MTYEVFLKQMTGMAIVYKEPLDDVRWPVLLDIYWARFRSWPEARFLAVVDLHLTISKFFPKPFDLLELGRYVARAAQPVRLALPQHEETPEDRQAREEAMAAMRALVESGPLTTRMR
jgi:hypothetical protein